MAIVSAMLGAVLAVLLWSFGLLCVLISWVLLALGHAFGAVGAMLAPD